MKNLIATFCRVFVILQFASALQDTGGLSRHAGIDGKISFRNSLFHRRVKSNIRLEEGRSRNNEIELATTSTIYEQGARDLGLEKMIIGGSNAGAGDYGDLQKYVVGGSDAANGNEDRFPWFVRPIGKVGNTLSSCGGALIAPDVIITAAHCDDPMRVMVSPYNLRDINLGINGNMVRVEVVNNRRHPQYSEDQAMTVDYDVMLSKLDEPVLDVAPIRLNFDDNFPSTAGESLLMLGFGSVIGGPETGLPDGPIQPSTILQEAPTDYVPFEECAVANDPESNIRFGISPTQTIVKDFWLCTLRADTSSCFGDSGGPIIKEGTDAESDLLVGVISGAVGYCGQPYLPLWNNRVSSHQEWIKDEGCKLSTMPPDYWGCPEPPPTEPPIATDPPTTNPPPPTEPPLIIPITESPSIQQPSPQPSSLQPTISEPPTIVPSERESFFDQTFWYITGASVGGIFIISTLGFILWKRRKNRIDDIDQHSAKDDSKPSKSGKKKHRKSAGKYPANYSPTTSIASDQDSKIDAKGRIPFFAKFSKKKSSKDQGSINVDIESQHVSVSNDSSNLSPGEALNTSDETEDVPDDDVRDAQENMGDKASGKKAKRYFPSFFKSRKKATKEAAHDDDEDSIEIPFQKQDESSEVDFKDRGERTESENDRETDDSVSLAVQVDYDELEVPSANEQGTSRSLSERSSVPNDTGSLAVQVDYDELGIQPRGDHISSIRGANSFDDDIKAVVNRGKERSLGRSHSLDRDRAAEYARMARMRQRSLSQQRPRANDFASKTRQGRVPQASPFASEFAPGRNDNIRPRSLSKERPFASEFVSDGMGNRRPRSMSNLGANELASTNLNRNPPQKSSTATAKASNFPPNKVENSRQRGRSIDRSETSRFASDNGNQHRSKSNVRPDALGFRGSRGRSREQRSSSRSLERNRDPVGDRYSIQRNTSSLDPSPASNFSNYRSSARMEATPNKYLNQRRSSSLDRSGARNFANYGPSGTKYTSRNRSSSLDRSRANNFAHNDPLVRSSLRGNNVPPDSTYDPQIHQVSFPKATIRTQTGEHVVENGSSSGAIVTKNSDGSVVVAVKRRRADGALVTTKTKFANIRLARKYGVAI